MNELKEQLKLTEECLEKLKTLIAPHFPSGEIEVMDFLKEIQRMQDRLNHYSTQEVVLYFNSFWEVTGSKPSSAWIQGERVSSDWNNIFRSLVFKALKEFDVETVRGWGIEVCTS